MTPSRDLPSFLATVWPGGENDQTWWYDVKFYPYSPPGAPPVFAVTGASKVVICRCVSSKDNPIEILRCFDDDSDLPHHLEGHALNTLTWACAANGDPLVCVAGSDPRIKVLNVKTGKLVTTLAGHGATVNDLEISPADSLVLASASGDKGIRLWSLDPAHTKQQTAAILYGEGHHEEVIAIGFHRRGQWLLSGGGDSRVILWHVPSVQKGGALPDKPETIHYPHFSSAEIHSDYVDCIKFYNDLILSKAARGSIVLWRIDDFDALGPVPPPPVPTSSAVVSSGIERVPLDSITHTRSAWGGRFQRLLTFDLPGQINEYYLRFSLHHELGIPTTLAAGNEQSKVFFWNLQHLETAGVGEELTLPGHEPKRKSKPLALQHNPNSRAGSESSTTSSATQQPNNMRGIGSNSSRTTTPVFGDGIARVIKKPKARSKSRAPDRAPDRGTSEPFYPIPAHSSKTIPDVTKAPIRQVGWSKCGNWCVATGDYGQIAIFKK